VRLALDTNILVYAEGCVRLSEDRAKFESIVDLLKRLDAFEQVIPLQTLGEFYAILTRKFAYSPGAAADAIKTWQDGVSIGLTTPIAFTTALELVRRHKFSIWDAAIFSVAAENGCRFLLSEDMADGFSWAGTTVVNPFAKKLNRAFATLLVR
jgi:predicted nucleic acid-binding protein